MIPSPSKNRRLIAKLSYAASAWWGFASADDKQRLNAFIRRSMYIYVKVTVLPTSASLISSIQLTIIYSTKS